MPSLKFVYLLIFGFATLHSFTVMGEDADLFDTCPIMDPATIQRRICELQYRVEELHALLFNGLPDDNQITSDTTSGLNVKKKKEKMNSFDLEKERMNLSDLERERMSSSVSHFFRFGRSANPEEPEEQFVAKRKNEFIRFG
uniref:Uncharacterized protein n=1 Tax=Panagrolaimus superbus TaxID=310955 RepID=A0A914Z0Z9_9BILA